jgi:beta-lactamase superfamily II metal-dependent hydrolase
VLACAALTAAVIGSASLAWRDLARRRARDLTVTFLDIGQGDAAVIEAPGPAVMLVDGGGTRDGSFDTGARIVEPFLRARGIGRVDVVALSHPHPDHLNGPVPHPPAFRRGRLLVQRRRRAQPRIPALPRARAPAGRGDA